MKYESLYPHLDFSTDTGWGYLPPSKEIMDVIDFVATECKPKMLLEIGYYAGHSTSYLAHRMPDCQIISCCPNHPMFRKTCLDVEKAYSNVKIIGNMSPGIIDYVCDWIFDFAFIDGSHHKMPVQMDVALCLTLGVEWILFDNADQRGVREGIAPYRDRMKKVKSWDYYGENKGKVSLNTITLFRVKG